MTMATAVALAACTVQSTTVERAQTEPRPGTTIAYNVNAQTDFGQAARQADEWCRETYDTTAVYLDQTQSTAGDVVRFGCVVE